MSPLVKGKNKKETAPKGGQFLIVRDNAIPIPTRMSSGVTLFTSTPVTRPNIIIPTNIFDAALLLTLSPAFLCPLRIGERGLAPLYFLSVKLNPPPNIHGRQATTMITSISSIVYSLSYI